MNARMVGTSTANTNRAALSRPIVGAERYRSSFDNARRLPELVLELETTTMSLVDREQGWEPGP